MAKKIRLDWKKLRGIGVPALPIPGILWANIYGVKTGDIFELISRARVRLLGVDSPSRGKQGWEEARDYLGNLVEADK